MSNLSVIQHSAKFLDCYLFVSCRFRKVIDMYFETNRNTFLDFSNAILLKRFSILQACRRRFFFFSNLEEIQRSRMRSGYQRCQVRKEPSVTDTLSAIRLKTMNNIFCTQKIRNPICSERMLKLLQRVYVKELYKKSGSVFTNHSQDRHQSCFADLFHS